MCRSCEALRINGVLCHESGCPDAWQDEVRECAWCGGEFSPADRHERCCSPCCAVAFAGLTCNECYEVCWCRDAMEEEDETR